jgi:hypothetical protein
MQLRPHSGAERGNVSDDENGAINREIHQINFENGLLESIRHQTHSKLLVPPCGAPKWPRSPYIRLHGPSQPVGWLLYYRKHFLWLAPLTLLYILGLWLGVFQIRHTTSAPAGDPDPLLCVPAMKTAELGSV